MSRPRCLMKCRANTSDGQEGAALSTGFVLAGIASTLLIWSFQRAAEWLHAQSMVEARRVRRR